MKKFILIILLLSFFAMIIILVGGSQQADINQQEWCKEAYEILFAVYDGQYTNKLTESEINTIDFLLDSYFEAYQITIGEEWNSGVVIWQMFIVSTPDDISRALAEEAVENYNKVYGRSYELGSNKEGAISETFLMQKFLLEYTGKTKPLELCKTWEELN